MPQAVAAWVASAWSGAAVGGLAGTVAVGTVTAVSVGVGTALVYAGAYIVAAAAIGLGVSTLMGAIMGKPGSSDGSLSSGALNSGSPLQMSRNPIPNRRVIYGETRVSGPMLDAFVSGANNEYLNIIVGLAAHECAAINDVFFGDTVEALDGAGQAVGTYAGFARVKKVLGLTGQAADADFVADSGGQRSATDKFDRIAYLYGRFKWDQAKWPGGFPNLSAIVRGRKCYDPRTGLTVWTANPALCIRDYLVNTEFGLGVDPAELDEASIIAAANICDEAVALAGGGTEPRYRLNGSFETSAEPATILEKMVESMAGAVVYVGGYWIIYAGAHNTPESSHLTEDDLRGQINVQTKLSIRDTCNRVRGTFVSPDEKYQPADFTPITGKLPATAIVAGKDFVITEIGSTNFVAIGAASNTVGLLFRATAPGTGTGYVDHWLGEDNGVEIWRDRAFAFVTSHSQAQRLAKIDLERTRQEIAFTAPCKLTALRYKPGDVVPVDNAEMGWAAKLFMVTGLKFATYDAQGELALGVDLDLRETAAAVWNWNSGMETTYDPAPNTNLNNPLSVAVPVITLNAAGPSELSVQPRLRVGITPPADQFIISGGFTEIQWKKHVDADWRDWSRLPGGQWVDFITDLAVGTSYDVRARFINSHGVAGAYCAAVTLAAPAGSGDYTGNLTNDSHVIACDAEGNPLAGEVGGGGRAFTDIQAWAGNTALAGVAGVPVAGQFKISAIAVVAGVAGYTQTDPDTVRVDSLTSPSAIIRITVNMEGVLSMDLDFSVAKAIGGGVYFLITDVAAVNKSVAGAYTPATVNFSAWSKLQIAAPAAYPGRFIIATWDGVAWTNVYTSAADETTKAYVVPAAIKAIRCRLYLAGGTVTQVDEEVIPVTFDGAVGDPGPPGDPGDPGPPGADGSGVIGWAGGGGSASTTAYSGSYVALSPALTLTVGVDGLAKMVKFSGGYIVNSSGTTQNIMAAIYRGATLIAEFGNGYGVQSAGAGVNYPMEFSGPDTPAAGTVTYELKVKGGTNGLGVSAGGKLAV